MPIYRYRCAACEAEDEVIANVDDPPPEACSKCGATGSLSKLVARSAFHLKGGGWYAQGYGSSGSAGTEASSDSDSSSGDSDSSSGDSDSSGGSSSSSSSSSSDSNGSSSSSDD